MLRTQIFLPEDYYQQLQNLSRKRDTSMGELIRIFIKKGLGDKDNPPLKGNDLASLSALKIKGGPKDLSKNFDYYLYR